MRPFKYSKTEDAAEAVKMISANANSQFLAGGTNLIDLMKEDVARPDELVDITRLKLAQIKTMNGGVTIGALAKNTDTANHPLIRQNYPLLTQAILAGASGQIRNMATNGGNLESTNALFVFLRYGNAVQQTRTEFRLRRTRRNQSNARDFRLVK